MTQYLPPGPVLAVSYVVWYAASAVVSKMAVISGAVTFNTGLSVLLTELCKFCISLALLAVTAKSARIAETMQSISLRSLWRDAVPAFLYCMSNNIIYFVYSKLFISDVVVLSTIRLAIMAGLTYYFFGRGLKAQQFFALLIFIAAVYLVTNGSNESSPGAPPSGVGPPQVALSEGSVKRGRRRLLTFLGDKEAATNENNSGSNDDKFVALLFTLAVCLNNSFASIWSEMLLKERDNPHLAGARMYAFGIIFNACVSLVFHQYRAPTGASPFFGWTLWVGLDVVMNAGDGLLCAFLLKTFDQFVKIICTQTAAVATFGVEMVLLGRKLESTFMVALSMVIVGHLVYNM